jgi:hypothetical protein
MRKGNTGAGDGASESGDFARFKESTTLPEAVRPAGRSGLGVVETPVRRFARGFAVGRLLAVERMGARL